MKSLAVVLFLLSSFTNWAQIVHFTSPITQTWPTLFTTDFKEVERIVFFDIEEVTITTETAIGKDFKVFQILSVESINGDLKFNCTDRNKILKITIILPEEQNFIDIYEPSLTTGEEIQTRIHIDQKQ